MFRFIVSQLLQLFSNLSDMLELLFRIPLRALGLTHDHDAENRKRGIAMRILIGLGKLLLLPFALLAGLIWLPVRAMTVFPPERRHDFLLGIPSVIVILLISLAALRAPIQAEAINNNYRRLAHQAMYDQEYKKSATYFGRIVNSTKDPGENDLFSWAISLAANNDERATGIINRLAPDDSKGLAKAHELKAINLSDNLGNNLDPARYKTLKHHLDQCRESDSPRLNIARANYYRGIDDLKTGLSYIEKAAVVSPQFYLVVADACAANGDSAGRDRALENGLVAFRKNLAKDPFDNASRIFIAMILTGQDNLDEAEKVLADGIRINVTPDLNLAMSSFLVTKFDRSADQLEYPKRLAILQTALQYNINNVSVYERLGSAHQDLSSEELASVKTVLNDSIASGQHAALAHFTLSNILWQEDQKDQAFWHVEQAYRLEPEYLFVANNLAYMLAVGEHKDLDRALELAREVVNRNKDPRFLDTLGTIYFEMGEYEKALEQLQLAMEGGLNQSVSIHQKLERIYTELNQPALAAAHHRKALELTNE